MIWPDRHGMIYGMAAVAWYILWPGVLHMVYGMAWRTSHGIWYGLARYVMVCGKACNYILKACPWTIVPFHT